MAAYDASQWTELLVAAAGASAALAGLVFVAVSINIEAILKLPGLPDRALLTLLLLLGVVVVSLLGLVPGQSRTALSIELLVEGIVCTVAIAVLTARSLPRDAQRSWVVGRLAVAAIGTLPFVVGGASLLAQAGGGLYWTFAGILGALVGAVMTAWVLLVEILR